MGRNLSARAKYRSASARATLILPYTVVTTPPTLTSPLRDIPTSFYQMPAAVSLLRLFRSPPEYVPKVFFRGLAVASCRTSGPKYHWNEGVENIETYRGGGYHPIQLRGNLTRGRYKIFHKLGHSTFSTVLLAQDHLEKRYL